MAIVLDFTSNDVLLAVHGVVHRQLTGRLESGELGAQAAWVNVTWLMPDGKASKLFHARVGKSSRAVELAEPAQCNKIKRNTEIGVHRLLGLHLVEGRFSNMPLDGSLDHNGTFSLPHGIGVLLVSCVGFPDWRANGKLSQIIGIWLSLELLRLSGQLELNPSSE